MKFLATLLLVVTSSLVRSQCTWTNYRTDSTSQVSYVDGALRADGGMMVLAKNENGRRDMVAMRMDPAGDLIWRMRLNATNPRIWFIPTGITTTPDGGMVAFGNLGHSHTSIFPLWYKHCNQFAIKLDSLGNQEWARIYQGLNVEIDNPVWVSFEVLNGGGYLMTFCRYDGIRAAWLDQSGVPLSSTLYKSDPVLWHAGGTVLSVPNGDLVFAAVSAGSLHVVHTNTQGQPNWAKLYDLDANSDAYSTHISKVANGDYLIGWLLNDVPTLTRIDATGGHLWTKIYEGGWECTGITELSGGDLLVTMDFGPVLRTASDGTPLEMWNHPINLGTSIYQLGLRNDSIFLGTTMDATDGWYPAMLRAENVATLSCGLPSAPLTSVSPAVLLSVTDTLVMTNDSTKTWTLALNVSDFDSFDVEVHLSSGIPRPGFPLTYYGNAINGSGKSSGPLETTFTFDPLLTYTNATPTPTSVVGNVVTWSAQPALGALGEDGYMVSLQVPASTAIGTDLTSTLAVTQDSAEVTLANNVYSYTRTVTGSYDPNEKSVRTSSGQSATTYIIGTDEYLDYTILFQNTGNDTAFTVVVVDSLPLELDRSSFQLAATSHPCTYEMGGDGIARFIFNNILLPDSNTNEPLSHGLINFRIATHKPEIMGTEISNVADIFFDFNAPVRTPAAVITLGDLSTSVRPSAPKEKLQLYPVPVKDVLTIAMPAGFEGRTLSITAHDGRTVMVRPVRATNGRTEITVAGLAPGGYLIEVRAADGKRLAARFTKE